MRLMLEKKGRAGNACRAIWPTPPRAPQDQAKGLSAHVDYIPVWNLICRDSALVYFFPLQMRKDVGRMTTSTRQTGVTDMTKVYIVRTKDMSLIRRVNARSERQAVSKVARKHGAQDYLVYQF